MEQWRNHQERFRGMILGTAVGDSLGLPAEGLLRNRIRKLFPGRWQQRLLIRFGMVSDDTDHTFFVSQSLLVYSDSEKLFAKRLARSFIGWLLTIPAGIGSATLRSIARLCIGISPARSGVYSAGNGPAMRSAPIGAFFSYDKEKMERFLQASTLITHTDPKALTGARAVATVTAWIIKEDLRIRPDLDTLLNVLYSCDLQDSEWKDIISKLSAAHLQNLTVEEFADSLGLSKGISGYIYHTVPVALYSWYRHFGNFEETINSVLNCGGDTDTVGAIAGAMAGAVVGDRGIPEDWIDRIFDWPRSNHLFIELADRLSYASQNPGKYDALKYFWPGLFLRGIILFLVVFLHILRRAAPPY